MAAINSRQRTLHDFIAVTAEVYDAPPNLRRQAVMTAIGAL